MGGSTDTSPILVARAITLVASSFAGSKYTASGSRRLCD